jgi:hypothetical protein
MPITGGCLCGRVRYSVEGEAKLSAVCHCRSCQRYTGSAFEPLMVFPTETVKVEGELKTYDDPGDSGNFVHRQFCPNCGSSLMAEVDVMPGVRVVLAGSLDDPAVFQRAWKSSAPARSRGCWDHPTSGRNSTVCQARHRQPSDPYRPNTGMRARATPVLRAGRPSPHPTLDVAQ